MERCLLRSAKELFAGISERVRCAASTPAAALTGLYLVLQTDHTGFARLGLLAALLHEWGHILVYRRLSGHWPRLRWAGFGVALAIGETEFCPREQFLLAAAGPCANFLWAAGAWVWVTQIRAGYYPAFFAAANVCVGAFNLLPVGPLDGNRMLCLGKRHWGRG